MGGNYIEIAGGSITETYEGDYDMFAGGNIITNAAKSINETGKEDGVLFGVPQKPPKEEAKDFDIKIILLKDESEFLPLGILNYKGKKENASIKFKITVTGDGANGWELNIKNNNGILYTCYSSTQELKEVIVTAQNTSKTTDAKKENSQTVEKRYWPAGDYILEWDGFDNGGVYDSKVFTNSEFVATIEGNANMKYRSAETDKFGFKYDEVKWVDIKVWKEQKAIDVMLRVSLKDGGAEGLECVNLAGTTMNTTTICPWDKIPPDKIKPHQPIIKQRTKDFEDLERLAMDGLIYHWGRNKGHAVAKSIKVNDEFYEVDISVENIIDNVGNREDAAIKSIKLIYNTNSDWMRSGNPGEIKGIVSGVGNLISGRRIAYNVGYLNFTNWYQIFKAHWDYIDEVKDNVEEDFAYTTAHETGHAILQAYGGTHYSYTHDGSSNLGQSAIPLKENKIAQKWDALFGESAKSYKVELGKGEINLMHYFEDQPWQKYIKYENIAATEKQVIGLLWCSKIKIQ